MTTIFDNEERADLRRTLDGDMTSGILGIINPLAKSCALAVALQLTDRANAADNVIKYHYLQGGNAISILANQPTTGDYDFQVVILNHIVCSIGPIRKLQGYGKCTAFC